MPKQNYMGLFLYLILCFVLLLLCQRTKSHKVEEHRFALDARVIVRSPVRPRAARSTVVEKLQVVQQEKNEAIVGVPIPNFKS